MKNYSEMSDNEINKRVGHCLGYTEQGRGWIHNADGIYDYMSKPGEDYRQSLPDYCNSWFHAGPILHEESIGIRKDIEICCDICGEYYETDFWEASHCLENCHYTDENPLRAAMIVFLMIYG